MIILLSPAKNLDFSDAPDTLDATRPPLASEANRLSEVTRQLVPGDLKRMMKISDKLAGLNYERFQAFKTRGKPAESKQAALAFNGDVYQGLDAESLSSEELIWAQNHVRILSGLYGILRPLDRIQPYRLEMGTKLATERGETLYDWWGDRVSKEINKAVRGRENKTVVNLASNEYFKAVDRKALKSPIISVQFKDVKDGKARMLQFYAKRARGMMARWAIINRVDRPDGLKDFDMEGYRFEPKRSDPRVWVFHRPQPAPKNGK